LTKPVLPEAINIKYHAEKNIEELKDLMTKVPEGQKDLKCQIQRIIYGSLHNQKDAKKLQAFGEQLRDGKVTAKNGLWNFWGVRRKQTGRDHS
jgi:hypothetical protein